MGVGHDLALRRAEAARIGRADVVDRGEHHRALIIAAWRLSRLRDGLAELRDYRSLVAAQPHDTAPVMHPRCADKRRARDTAGRPHVANHATIMEDAGHK